MKGSRFDFREELLPVYVAHGTTIFEQYRDLGSVFATPVVKSYQKIKRQRSPMAKKRKLVAAQTLSHLIKLADDVAFPYRQYVSDYLEAVRGWGEGAGLKVEEAIVLMADNHVACQTGMVRLKKAIAMFHTEEDFANIVAHFSVAPMVEVRIDNRQLRSLVYNDLLPGSALFGYSHEHTVAVDSLYIDIPEKDTTSIMLANVVAWITWRMNPKEITASNMRKMIKKLGWFVDPYAINVMVGESGLRILFAGDKCQIDQLGHEPGAYLTQINTWYGAPDSAQLSPKWRRYFRARKARLDLFAQSYPLSDNLEEIQDSLYSSSWSKVTDLANPDVGATCASVLKNGKTRVSIRINEGEVGKNLV